jgi:hypothetical protein
MSRKLKWRIVVALLAIVLLYPFKTTVAPAERVLVVTKDMHPVKDALIRQIWQNYSLEFGGHEEDLPTDVHGRVTLPERTIRANLIWRILGPLASIAGQGVHASFGAHFDEILVPNHGTKASDEVMHQQLGEYLYRLEL